MPVTTCRHPQGDWITEQHFWLCSTCWERLAARPVRYGGTPLPKDWAPGQGYPQSIVWQAAVHVDQHGNTLGNFLRAMVKRFQMKTRPKMHTDDAYDLAIDILKGIGDPFGDPAYDWSAAGAREIADDEMQYFDSASTVAN